jgi:aspartate 1-decarboxylase
MLRRLLKSKVHRATVTAADLHYEGSLTLDADLMNAADLLPYEAVQVVNVNNGERFVTYLLAGPAGSGVVQLNGAAARLGYPGDLVIIMAFADLDEDELPMFEPAVVFVDARNRIVADPGVPGR